MAEEQESQRTPATVEVPASTPWPMITALGLTLLLAGLVTNVLVSAVGLILLVLGAVFWAGEVMPHARVETVAVIPAREFPAPVRLAAERLEAGVGMHRATLPLEIYPYSAGVKGGIAGGVVMALLAVGYSLFRYHSPWYTVNLLAGTVFPSMASASTAALSSFNLEIFLTALTIHAVVSLTVGLLYGIMLPMLPRNPILLGGLIGPLLWSGILWATLRTINPVLAQRLDWAWFVVCQIGFGLTAGIVTARSVRIATIQHLPFAIRSGIQTPGLSREREEP